MLKGAGSETNDAGDGLEISLGNFFYIRIFASTPSSKKNARTTEKR